jgi:hypothetical protein
VIISIAEVMAARIEVTRPRYPPARMKPWIPVQAPIASASNRLVHTAPEDAWARTPDGLPQLIEAQTVIFAAGQESHNPCSRILERRVRLIRAAGGALAAVNLDAVRRKAFFSTYTP